MLETLEYIVDHESTTNHPVVVCTLRHPLEVDAMPPIRLLIESMALPADMEGDGCLRIGIEPMTADA